MRLLKAFQTDNKGAIAVLLGVTLSVLVLSIGVAIDFGYQSKVKRDAQKIADAAALAAAANLHNLALLTNTPSKSQATTAKTVATNFIDANFLIAFANKGVRLKSQTVDIENGRASIALSTTHRPFFAGILGISELETTVTAEAGYDIAPSKNIDIVFALDTTMSMGPLTDALKIDIINFSKDLKSQIEATGANVGTIRVKFVMFRDYMIDIHKNWTGRRMALISGMERYGPMFESPFFVLPVNNLAADAYINFFAARGGGSPEESGLEALWHSINSADWSSDQNTVRIVSLWTDNPPRRLGDYTEIHLDPSDTSWTSATWDSWIGPFFTAKSKSEREKYAHETFYPKDMPSTLEEFQKKFEAFHLGNVPSGSGTTVSLFLNVLGSCQNKTPCGDWDKVKNWSGVSYHVHATMNDSKSIYQKMIDQIRGRYLSGTRLGVVLTK
ncbi:MAG: hypothetical protein KDJ36_09800 [Hyphomicrobiaceae bacterium]|nr:hypothetical protein [Hyphomicrobiaceae bacterium]